VGKNGQYLSENRLWVGRKIFMHQSREELTNYSPADFAVLAVQTTFVMVIHMVEKK